MWASPVNSERRPRLLGNGLVPGSGGCALRGGRAGRPQPSRGPQGGGCLPGGTGALRALSAAPGSRGGLPVSPGWADTARVRSGGPGDAAGPLRSGGRGFVYMSPHPS